MRFSYLHAVLICGVLLDSANRGSAFGQTKLVALAGPHEVHDHKGTLRLHAAADSDQEERMAAHVPIEGLPARSIKTTNAATRLRHAVKNWLGNVRDEVIALFSSRSPEYFALLKEIRATEDKELKTLSKKVKILGSPRASDMLASELSDPGRAVTLELAQRFPELEAKAKEIELKMFKTFEYLYEDPSTVFQETIKQLKNDRFTMRAQYLQDFVDKFVEWRKSTN